ncbi:hypothetical protein [Celerinatantimonas sp. MCCC 1A17872]|uniref:hypothetical protein n=1 Tax=Celerinatantimonas sp. MCCC 1A17872 TaxID=3177514 RepID=UPI0038BFAA70
MKLMTIKVLLPWLVVSALVFGNVAVLVTPLHLSWLAVHSDATLHLPKLKPFKAPLSDSLKLSAIWKHPVFSADRQMDSRQQVLNQPSAPSEHYQLMAILRRSESDGAVILQDSEQHSWVLRVGHQSRDGWTLSKLGLTSATLTKGNKVKQLKLHQGPRLPNQGEHQRSHLPQQTMTIE